MSSKQWKKSYNKAYKLWKEVCFKRDGELCQVKFHYGCYTSIIHSDVLQVDHCFSRGNHFLHLEPRNGTVVCSCCNLGKKYGSTPAGHLINEIVKKREGKHFSTMLFVFQSRQINTNWNKVWWMEEQIKKLEDMKREMDDKKT